MAHMAYDGPIFAFRKKHFIKYVIFNFKQLYYLKKRY